MNSLISSKLNNIVSGPKVTIITVTYNLITQGRKSYFLQMIDSVKSQTYNNIEHIIIDGASQDETLELIKSTGLKYISEPDNGIYYAMNKGITLAKGKYICFMNSDDYFSDVDAVKYTIEKLEKENADYSFATAKIIDGAGKELYVLKPNIYGVFSKMPFCHQTMFTKTEVLKKEGMFDLAFKSAADYDLVIRLVLKKYKFAEIKQNIVTYRATGESVINIEKSRQEQVKIYKKLYSKYVNLTNNEYENILIKNTIPFKLLFALKIYNWNFYKNYIDFNKFRKGIISLKISINKGLEYLILFNKVIYHSQNIIKPNHTGFPIIFVHKGIQEYFILALKQARKYNPDARIIVIGDQDEDKYPDFVEFYNLNDLTSNELIEFRKLYVHKSVNDYNYEIFCFERWFLILELIKRLNIEAFLHLDSDIFIYCNAKEEFEKYKNYKFTYCGMVKKTAVQPVDSGHSSYFNSCKALEGFTNFILDFYKNVCNDNSFKFAQSKHISDMSLITWYEKEVKYNCVNKYTPFDESSWDFVLRLDCQNLNVKSLKFYINKGLLYAYLPNGRKINFKTLHFQGRTKILMKPLYNKKQFVIMEDLINDCNSGIRRKKYFGGLITKESRENKRKYTVLGLIKISKKKKRR